jgi:catechol 2,3-dioxygenase-like lactoylglutathione lyase family enzyme
LGAGESGSIDAAPVSLSDRCLPRKESVVIRINATSVMVDDQEKALRFYTDVLGFVLKHDVPMGGPRWLTVVSPADPDGVELLLEPLGHPAARPFQQALYADGIPLTSFAVDDVHAEYERLSKLGVVFRGKPIRHAPVTLATLDDTCGNWIQIAQHDG